MRQRVGSFLVLAVLFAGGCSFPPGRLLGAGDNPVPEPPLVADYRHPVDGVPLPDGFVPRRLRPGERPPQFVIVSFDGAGWDEKWRHWFAVSERVPFRFTAFLSGTYLLSYRTRTAYHPPGYAAGTAAIGWYGDDDLPVEIGNLDRAVDAGDEIGTHFNGHFCVSAGLPSGGDTWTRADWSAELDQFFGLLRGYRADNRPQRLPDLRVHGTDILGDRTPCLEGSADALFPALGQHHMIYDSTFTRTGLSWPRRDRTTGIWQLGMSTFAVHGTLPDGRTGVPVTSMDYNYYFVQHGGSDRGVSTRRSLADSHQVLATYRDMYRSALAGSRAPLVLGNHFNSWNHDAYSHALSAFVSETCGRPDTECVPFRDLVAWLEVQRPRTLARLQALPPIVD